MFRKLQTFGIDKLTLIFNPNLDKIGLFSQLNFEIIFLTLCN